MLDIKRIRYVLAVAQERSFSGAAESLRIAQPALSSQIKDLERDLGVPLFSRHSRGAEITEAGEIVVRYGLQILDDLEAMRHEIKGAEKRPSGRVRMGIPYSVSVVLTVPLLQYLEKHYPEISLDVAQAFSGFVEEWLISDKVDCAVLLTDPRKSKLRVDPLVQEDLFLIVSAGSALAQRQSISFKKACEMPLILPTRIHGLRVLLEGVALSQNKAMNIKTEIDAGHELIKLVEQQFGATILARCSVHDQLQRGTVKAIRVTQPRLTRTVYLGAGKTGQRNRAIGAVNEAITHVTKELVKAKAWRAKIAD